MPMQLHHSSRSIKLINRRNILTLLWILLFSFILVYQTQFIIPLRKSHFFRKIPVPIPNLRSTVFNLTSFGAIGDGVTLNTAAFEKAVAAVFAAGGGQINVEAGYWLTAPFNLTSGMTLFLDEGAVILGVQDENLWPLMPPLPSYGLGREHMGPRYGSLVHGQNLTDVVITGRNGTIDGQGQSWWSKYKNKLLNHTRGPLVQIMWSRDIIISNLTFRNSPFWTLHPYDCKNITISDLTILAPVKGAPNTDGIDPDSCEGMVIKDTYICVGDDGIAIKSGWDQYGIAYGKPSANILIRNVTVRSVISAGVAIGSEMSGGISSITIENLTVWESRRGLRIKTAPGRGGYIHNITYNNIMFDNVRIGFILQTNYKEHPDEFFDPKALPDITNITLSGIHGHGVRVPVRIHGSKEIPVKGVTLRDFSVGISYKKKHIFQCSNVEGRTIGPIFPAPCENLDQYDEDMKLVKKATLQNVDIPAEAETDDVD